MQDEALVESVRSRLARGLPVRLTTPAGGEINVSVIQDDMLTNVIFAIGANSVDERPWRYEIANAAARRKRPRSPRSSRTSIAAARWRCDSAHFASYADAGVRGNGKARDSGAVTAPASVHWLAQRALAGADAALQDAAKRRA